MFTHQSEFARVETISEQGYTLRRYTSRQAANTGEAPIETIHRRGAPSVADCLAALPAGYADDHSGLPEIAAPPAIVSARQARLWLVRHGVSMAQVDLAIAGIADPLTRESVRIEWEYGTEVHRASQFVATLGATLGLDAATLDAAFREAAGL